MASEVDISNRALSKLGAERITSLADPSKGARAMLARYDLLRDAELEANPWRFAVTRTTLPALSTAPTYGYAYQYQRPSDDLRPLTIGNAAINARAVGVMYSVQRTYDPNAALYEIIGQTIQTDFGAPLEYEYIRRVTVTGEFPPLFVEALACRLAMDAAEELTQHEAKKQSAERQYSQAIQEARRVNSLYRPPRRNAPGNFMLSRISS